MARNQNGKSNVERILTEALQEAQQGKLRSLVLVTMKENGGTGYYSSFSTRADYEASFGHLAEMERDLRDLPNHPNSPDAAP